MSDATRVLFIDQSGELGGAELSLLDIAGHRRAAGRHDRVVLLSNGPFEQHLEQAGVDVLTLSLKTRVEKGSGPFSQAMAVPRVLGIARQIAKIAQDFDVIYTNTQKAAAVGSVAALLSRKPMIWHLRDMLDADHFSRANRRVIIGLTNRLANHIIANSQATSDAYHRAGGRLPTTVVHNGIDAAPFTSAKPSTMRADLDISDDAFLVGAFGRLTSWKGQHILLEALERESLASVHAILVGEALFTDEDRRYKTTLQERIDRGPLRGRGHLLGHRDDIPSLMKSCDAIVHSATSPEPFGRVIVEGMLAGKPVIAAKAGGAVEIVDDRETGLLTKPGDAGQLADAIGELRENQTLRETISGAGRAKAVDLFSVTAMVDRVNAVLEASV